MIARVHFGDTDRNLSHNPKVMQLVADAERTNDSARRAGLYRQALQIIADQAYWIPLYTYSVNYLMSPDLEFPIPPDGLPRLYEAHWKQHSPAPRAAAAPRLFPSHRAPPQF